MTGTDTADLGLLGFALVLVGLVALSVTTSRPVASPAQLRLPARWDRRPGPELHFHTGPVKAIDETVWLHFTITDLDTAGLDPR